MMKSNSVTCLRSNIRQCLPRAQLVNTTWLTSAFFRNDPTHNPNGYQFRQQEEHEQSRPRSFEYKLRQLDSPLFPPRLFVR